MTRRATSACDGGSAARSTPGRSAAAAGFSGAAFTGNAAPAARSAAEIARTAVVARDMSGVLRRRRILGATRWGIKEGPPRAPEYPAPSPPRYGIILGLGPSRPRFTFRKGPHVMRSILLALLVALGAAPAGARADLTLRLTAFDGPAAPAPRQHLELPALAVDGFLMTGVALDEGGGAGRRGRVEPAVSLILGIIPGFGIGHLIAGSQQWIYWLIADILIFVVWPGGFFFIDHGGAYPLLGLLVLVERIFEGLSAFQAAGGGPVFRSERGGFAGGLDSPAALALPVGSRAALLR